MVKIKEKGASSEITNSELSLDIKGISQWLYNKNIIARDNSRLIRYEDLNEWYRSGGETYSCNFSIEYEENGKVNNKKINVKAIVSTPIKESLENWERRRKHLANNNIPVSNWYWVGEGIIIEDFYPNEYHQSKSIERLIDIAYILDKLGYSNARNFLSDIRCDQNGNPFYIDFGFDLGECDYIFRKVAVNSVINKFPEKKEEISNYVNTKIHYQK